MPESVPDYQHVQLSSSAGVSTIVLDRAGHINAFNIAMYREIRSALRVADADPATSVILLRAAGDVFGVGGDLKEMLEFLDSDDPDLKFRYRDDLPFSTVRGCRKPTVAAVRGTCVGGGFGLASACDMIIAERGARFGIPEIRIGMIDGLAIAALHGHMPLPALKYLLFTGTLIDADEALRLGLLLDAVPTDRFEARVEEVCRELTVGSPGAIGAYKGILRSYDRPDHLDAMMQILVEDPGAAVRMRTFFDPRGERT
jgi:enoyl-CoA hydratase/carnithine racemase